MYCLTKNFKQIFLFLKTIPSFRLKQCLSPSLIHLEFSRRYDLFNYYKANGTNMTFKSIEIQVPMPEGSTDCRHDHIPTSLIDPIILSGSMRDDVPPSIQDDVQPNSSHTTRTCTMTIPALDKLTGYPFTNHSKTHDMSKEWVPFTPQDCMRCGERTV